MQPERDAEQLARLAVQRDEAREMLRRDYGIDSAFVRVPTLSKVLGLAQPTIYASMREGRFFLPHRLLNSSPAVRFEDLLEWYCSDVMPGGEGFRAGRPREAGARGSARTPTPQLSQAAVDEIVSSAFSRVSGRPSS